MSPLSGTRTGVLKSTLAAGCQTQCEPDSDVTGNPKPFKAPIGSIVILSHSAVNTPPSYGQACD